VCVCVLFCRDFPASQAGRWQVRQARQVCVLTSQSTVALQVDYLDRVARPAYLEYLADRLSTFDHRCQ